MSKNLADLTKDIYDVLLNGSASVDAIKEAVMAVGTGAATRMRKQVERAGRSTPREFGVLYASEIGHPCVRKAWYDFHEPNKAEPLTGQAKFKFLYGDMLEAIVLPLAKLAGHSVEGEGLRLESDLGIIGGRPWKIVGKTDAVIDGHVVDVKSMASPSFDKYTTQPIEQADTFGYRWQLGMYREAIPPSLSSMEKDPALLAIDKQLGKMAVIMVPDVNLYFNIGAEEAVVERGRTIATAIEVLAEPPRHANATRPEGKSGNMRLGTVCSYCAYKHHCFRDANNGRGLRGFYYASGPMWLAEVKKEPNVPEIPRVEVAAPIPQAA